MNQEILVIINHIVLFILLLFVIHDQTINVDNNIEKFKNSLIYLNLPNDYIHAGPIIRQENIYYGLSLHSRRKAIEVGINFIRTSPIYYHTFIIKRSTYRDEITITAKLSKEIKLFISKNYDMFIKYNEAKVYYDNGQKQLAKILASILPITMPIKVSFKNVDKAQNYYFFQAADIICTLELINIKINNDMFSLSEKTFFKTIPQFKSNYYKKIIKKII